MLFGFIGWYGNAVVEDNSGEQFGEAFDPANAAPRLLGFLDELERQSEKGTA